MWDRWSKKTFTVICCLADRELSEWSARCFMAAGLNSIACCSLADLERYTGWVQADAIVLDADVSTEPGTTRVWQRWTLAGGVACVIEAASATEALAQRDSPGAWSPRPAADLVFSKPLNCDHMAHALSDLLRRPSAPSDLRAEPVPAAASAVLRLDPRWCQAQVTPASGGSVTVELSAQEYRLLHALLQRAGEAVPRETLLAGLAKGGTGVETLRSVDQVVRRLRDALAPTRLHTALVTMRGEGYAWVEPSEPTPDGQPNGQPSD